MEVNDMSTALLQVRVDEALKHRVDQRLKRMGLTTSGAVNLLLHQIDIQGKIPFDIVDRPNDLHQAVRDINDGVGLSKVYHDTDTLYKDLGI